MRAILAIAVLVLVGIAGCQQGGSEMPDSATPFIGGTAGLITSFVENAPPAEVTDRGTFPFNVIVLLENTGEYTIPAERIKVDLSGFYPGDFGITDTSKLSRVVDTETAGVRKGPEGTKLVGDTAQIDFPTDSEFKYKKTLRGNIEVPIRAETCYYYENRAVGQYCMKSDILRTEGGVCEISGAKTIHNSGGPIQVQSFTESVAGTDAILLTLKIKHMGNGLVIRRGDRKKDTEGEKVPDGDWDAPCSDRLIEQEKVYVKIDAGVGEIDDVPETCTDDTGCPSKVEAYPLKCFGFSDTVKIHQGSTKEGAPASVTQKLADSPKEGYVKLSNGEVIITCKLDVRGVDATRPLTVEMSYDYLDAKTTEVMVKHLLT